MRFAALPILALTLICAAPPARAHALLDKAVPPVGGSVKAPPTEIRLFFSEPVAPQFSGVSLSTDAGAPIATGTPAQGEDKTVLVVPIKQALAPGGYRVKWRAVSVDTHRSQGAFAFTVGR